MNKSSFLIGLILLILSLIISNIFDENALVNRAIESFFFLPISYCFCVSFSNNRKLLNILFAPTLISCIGIFTPKWDSLTAIVVNVICCLISYLFLLFTLKVLECLKKNSNPRL